MQKITSNAELKEAILLLEIKQAREAAQLREQFKITYENLKPLNFIKNTVKELTTDLDFKDGLVDTTLSVAAGYLSKKVVIGATHNPLKQIFGTLLQMGVSSIVSKNTGEIKVVAKHLINLFSKKKTPA